MKKSSMSENTNPSKSLGRRIGKWAGRVFLVLLILVLLILVMAKYKPLPGEEKTVFGVNQNHSVYVTAEDGTRVAIDVWLPDSLNADQRIPTLVEGTRYWRATQVGWMGRVLNLIGSQAPGAYPGSFAPYFMGKGYAYLTVDVRGTGASFGVHDTEYSLQEVADYAAVLDWIVEQPWSNGNVGAVGVSYSGTTAELMTTTAHPALKAVAPLYSDFDAQFHLVTPGGVYQPAFVSLWSDMVSAMDANDLCGLVNVGSEEPISAMECFMQKQVVPGVKAVDGRKGKSLLKQAVAEHNSPNVEEMVANLEFRDSPFSTKGYSGMDNMVYGRKREIEASGVPMYINAGWLDAATVDGALARFVSFSNPQSVYIAPFSHGGGHDTDPYKPKNGELAWSRQEQLDRLDTFFSYYLKNEGDVPETGLSYYIMGANTWKKTNTWPPENMMDITFYLEEGNELAVSSPEANNAPDHYTVDFEAGTSNLSRWMTQLGGGDVVYNQRAEMAEKLLTYQTTPFEQDMELTGTVVLDLWMSSDQPDGALHAYLEDIAPDGTVRYLTEGILRLKHRKVSEEEPVHPVFGPYHSFLEKDAEPMPANEPQLVSLGLYATSALIKKGHRLRIAIGGADQTSFQRVPKEGPAPNWKIYRTEAMPSKLVIPLQPFE
jgi:putative CocE/NonD family hydrolase